MSSNSAFRKPSGREDQSVALKSNCVDDSNFQSVTSNFIGDSQQIVGVPNRFEKGNPSNNGGHHSLNKVLNKVGKDILRAKDWKSNARSEADPN